MLAEESGETKEGRLNQLIQTVHEQSSLESGMEIEGRNKMTPQIAMITKVPREYRGDPTTFKFLLI